MIPPQFLYWKPKCDKTSQTENAAHLSWKVLFFLMHFAFRLSFLHFTNFPYFLKEKKLRKWKRTDLAIFKKTNKMLCLFFIAQIRLKTQQLLFTSAVSWIKYAKRRLWMQADHWQGDKRLNFLIYSFTCNIICKTRSGSRRTHV